MKEILKDILSINGVKGVLLMSKDGKLLYESIKANTSTGHQRYTNWKKLIDILGKNREADFVFDKGRVYMRETGNGYMLISMEGYASIAMVKLNCDIVLPQLNTAKSGKGLKGLFKR